MKLNSYKFLSSIIKIYVKSLKVNVRVDSSCMPDSPKIYAFWHGQMFLLPVVFREFSDRVRVLISRHSDGEFAARLVKEFGFNAIRGSAGKRKGGVSAVLRMVDEIKSGFSVAIPVDGPKGPIHKVKKGVALLSIKTGVPVCPIAFRCSKGKHLSSWDRFFIPYPFSTCVVKVGKPVLPSYNESGEEFAERIERSLEALNENIGLEEVWKA